jgi:carboxymethylenebutenolidase
MTTTSKEIKIPATDGGAFMAYTAMPEDASSKNEYPAIVVIQEIFGVNSDMRAKCDELATQGYIAICPDLFWRIEPEIQLVDSEEPQLERAFELYNQFDEEKGLTDLQTTLGYIRHEKKCNKKVGAVGYCLGGKLAFMMSCHTDIDASVSYYGVAIDTLLDQTDGINSPILLHIAGNDEYVDETAREKINTHMNNHPHGTPYVYDNMDHAFARINGMHYNEDAANLANNRTETFFKTHLK